jgi:hypothetical protein
MANRAGSGQLGFTVNNGVSDALRINASGNVGIGTSNPTNALDIEADGDGVQLKLGRTVSNVGSTWMGADANGFHLGVGAYGSGNSVADPNGFTVDTSGNVGIGTSNPSTYGRFVVQGSGNPNAGRVVLDGFGTSAYTCKIGPNDDGIGYYSNNNSRGHVFYTGTADTERMRISSSGNIKIGNPNKGVSDAGEGILFSGAVPGLSYFTRDGGITTSFARLNSYGGVVRIVANGNLGGQIGSGSSGDLSFYNGPGTAEHMRISSSGNVGIGTSSPSELLEISGVEGVLRLSQEGGAYANLRSSDFGTLYIDADAGNTSANSSIRLSVDAVERMRVDNNGHVEVAEGGKLYLKSSTAPSPYMQEDNQAWTVNTGSAERMRISASGDLHVGKSAQDYTVNGVSLSTAGSAMTAAGTPLLLNRDGNGTILNFYVNDSYSGYITQSSGSAPSFGQASDERLKDNIVDHESELANVMSLRPTRWDWKDESRGSGEGFIAQELEATAWSDLVSEGDNGFKQVSGLGTVETRLIKAMQEQQAMIEALKAEVEALKNA